MRRMTKTEYATLVARKIAPSFSAFDIHRYLERGVDARALLTFDEVNFHRAAEAYEQALALPVDLDFTLRAITEGLVSANG